MGRAGLGLLTSSVQLGFIAGTLLYALLTIADRFSPSWVFFVSALAGAGLNVCITLDGMTTPGLLVCRFLTGFFLAGVYPVGMKIAADYYPKGLGKALGFLVGALVLGTALPHLLRSLSAAWPWKTVLYLTSMLALTGGGLLVGLVPDGATRRVGKKPVFRVAIRAFENRHFRQAALGYFGHMWELYAFWAFVPVMLGMYEKLHPQTLTHTSLWAFVVIGVGSLACVAGGYVSGRLGIRQTAAWALGLSGLCAVVSPLAFGAGPVVFLGFVMVWGMVVIADSPLFSALVAQNALPEIKGTALTVVTCIGFAITVISIQLLGRLVAWVDEPWVFLVLLPGPVLGLAGLYVGGKRKS